MGLLIDIKKDSENSEEAVYSFFVDYEYTGTGPNVFPKFTEALLKDDTTALKKEYLRYLIVGVLISLAILGFWYYKRVKNRK